MSAPAIPHNLPRRDYSGFIGRMSELEQIADWLEPDNRAWLMTVDGIGGIGKSALALEVGYRLLNQQPPFAEIEGYEAVVWVSAKANILLPSGIAQHRDFFGTLEDIYTTLAEVLGREEIIRAQPQDQARLVQRLLRQHQLLLIVDNLETVSDKSVIAFLSKKLPPPCKALITTRERIYLADPLRLGPLSAQDNFAYINQKCANLSPPLTQPEKRQLHKNTGGIPLAINLTVSRLLAGYPRQTVLTDIDQVQEELVDYCIQSSMEALQSQDGQQVLLALALFADDASYTALRTVANVADAPFRLAVARLNELSLLNESQQAETRYSMLPLTKRFVERLLRANPTRKQALVTRQVDYYLAFLADIGYYYTPENWEKLPRINSERDNLFELLGYLYEQAQWQSVLEIFTYIYGYLSLRGYWSDYLRWMDKLNYAVTAMRNTGDLTERTERLYGWCLSEQCWIEVNMEKFELAEATGLQALEIFRSIGEKDGQARALRHLGVMSNAMEDYKQAQNYFEQALFTWQAQNNSREAASIYNNLGAVHRKQGDFTKAKEQLYKSLSIKENLNDLTRIPNTLFYLGEVYFEEGDPQKAKTHFDRAIEIAQISGETLYQGLSYYKLAEIASINGDNAQIFTYGNLGVTILRNLGKVKEAVELQNLIDDLVNDSRGEENCFPREPIKHEAKR